MSNKIRSNRWEKRMVEITLTSRAAVVLGKVVLESKIDGDNMLAARDAKRALQGKNRAFYLQSGANARGEPTGMIICPYGKELDVEEGVDFPEKSFLLENAAFKFCQDRWAAVKAIKDDKDPRGLPSDLSEGACDLEESFAKAKKDVEKKKEPKEAPAAQ